MEIRTETAVLTDYKETDEYKALQVECYSAAKQGNPIDLSSLSAPEYKYFSELYKVYVDFTSKKLDEEKAKDAEKALYKEFVKNDSDRLTYIANIAFWNDNIRKASASLSELTKTEDKDKALDTALDILEKLLNNTIIKKTVYGHIKQEVRNESPN